MTTPSFGVFILTHGRPQNVRTLITLQRIGYTGKLWLVVDDEDKSLPLYKEVHGEDRVLVFSKSKYRQLTDDGDNFTEARSVLYARNACWDLAQEVGVDYFLQLDDDYREFFVLDAATANRVQVRANANSVFAACVQLLIATSANCVAMAQGGDYIGGPLSVKNWTHRKAMNSFFCATAKRFWFCSKLNDDVSTYCIGNRRGQLFFTTKLAYLNQQPTQQSAGGLTDIYLAFGTYVKSFYSVMYCPSAVRITAFGDSAGNVQDRIHHRTLWPFCSPKILPESFKKPTPTQ